MTKFLLYLWLLIVFPLVLLKITFDLGATICGLLITAISKHSLKMISKKTGVPCNGW